MKIHIDCHAIAFSKMMYTLLYMSWWVSMVPLASGQNGVIQSQTHPEVHLIGAIATPGGTGIVAAIRLLPQNRGEAWNHDASALVKLK